MLADFKFAFRQLFKKPGLSAVIILSLALGIGGVTTTFCWIQSIWLNPLPGVAYQDQVFVISPQHGTTTWHGCSLPDIQELETKSDVFEGVIGSQVTPAFLRIGERRAWIYGQIATANFFRTLGIQPILGRTFLPDEDKSPGGNAVLVISEGCWKREFGGDPTIVGRTVEINRQPFTIIGVTPAQFYGTMSGLRCDFWAPLSMHKQVANFGSLTNRYSRWLHTQARLRPNVSREQAQAALDVLSKQLTLTYPDANTDVVFKVRTFAQSPYGVQPIMLPALRILLVVSFGVLLVVAGNVANLLLARGCDRQKEIAIRLAVGANRFHLLRQLLIESVLLAFVGGGLGLIATFWMVDLLAAMIPPTTLPVGIGLAVNGQTLAFAGGLALLTGFVFGLVPALHSSRPDLNSTLKEGGRGAGTGRNHRRLRDILVVGEIAMSLILLVSASLCIRSAAKARHADVGFEPDHMLLAGLRIGMNGYTEETGKTYYQNLQRNLASLPEVEGVALASWFPLGFEHSGTHYVLPEGYQPKTGEDLGVPDVTVSPNFFATMKIPVLAGREFTPRDDTSAEPVGIINEALARRFWPGQNALGRRFKDNDRWRTVIGIVKTGKYFSINEPDQPVFFIPYLQGIQDLNLGLAIRTRSDPTAFVSTLRAEMQKLDREVEVWGTLLMKDYMKAAYTAPVLASRLLTAMGMLALALAAMGVYAVMAHSVGERMREFGLRMALGASPRNVLSLILRNGLTLAAWGVLAGLTLAIALTRLLASFLYNVSPYDAATLIGVPLLLAATALAAAVLPALRAMRADPCVALHSE
ncbi:MAG: ABC transporter permease [Nibricoccus sp.]